MSKIKNKKQNIEKIVMQDIEKGKIKMKPKWIFVAGSVIALAGLVASVLTSAFLVNLIIFLVRKQGPGIERLNMILSSFPLWIPIVALLGIIAGIFILHKYDFSYKKNFALIILAFVVSVLLAGLIMDKTGLNDVWSGRGAMKGFYQRIQDSGYSDPEYFRGGSGQHGSKYGYNRNR